jgi:hypothetical protein
MSLDCTVYICFKSATSCQKGAKRLNDNCFTELQYGSWEDYDPDQVLMGDVVLSGTHRNPNDFYRDFIQKPLKGIKPAEVIFGIPTGFDFIEMERIEP